MARNPKPPEGEQVVAPDDAPTPPGITGDEENLEKLTVPELEDEAALRGVDIDEGSGKGGAVVKADLVGAVADAPVPPAGRPPLITVAQSAVIPIPVED